MRRRVVVFSVASALLAATAVSGLLIAQAINGGAGSGPIKDVVLKTQVAEWQETADALPHAPKVTSTAAPRPTSCPIDPKSYTLGVFTPPILNVAPQPILNDVNVVSQANAFSGDGHPNGLLLGSLKNDDQQGVVVVGRGAKDPCVEGVQSYAPQRFLEPVKGQPVQFVSISGDTIVLANADGVTLSFNFVTGTFAGSPQPTLTPDVATLTPAAPATQAPPVAPTSASTQTPVPVAATPAP